MNKMFDAVDALFESNLPLTTSEEIVEEEKPIEAPKLEENKPYITLKNAKGKEYTIYKKGKDFYSDDNTKLTEDEVNDMRKDNEVYSKMEAKAQSVLDTFMGSDKSVEDFTAALNEISRLEWDNEIDSELYDKYIKAIQDAFKGREPINEDMSEEELVGRVKEGTKRGLDKCITLSDLEGVLNYYLVFVKDQLDENITEDDVNYTILDTPNDSKDFIVDLPADELPVDLSKQGRCPYCTGPMTDEEYRVFGMCKDCYDNGVE